MQVQVNVGCGATPTKGWRNFDNSPVVRIAKLGGVVKGLRAAGVLSEAQLRFAEIAREHGIAWANGAAELPLESASASVIYSSHMLEHLDRDEAARCLREFRRVLAPGGILRLAVPDMERAARAYLEAGDADEFVASTYLAQPRPKGLLGRARFALTGHRDHMWMYDARSLTKLLKAHGFEDVESLAPGATTIPSPGDLNLREREDESVYVEARKPRPD